MKKLGLAVFGTLLGSLLIALLLLFRGIELGFAVPFLEKQASKFLNREVHLGTPPRVQLGSDIEVIAGDISLANVDWAPDLNLASVEHVEVRLRLSSLFSDGPIVVEDFRLSGAHVALASDETEQSNLPELNTDGAEPEETAASEEKAGLGIVFNNMLIEEATLSRWHPIRGKYLDLRIDSLTQQARQDETLELHAAGELQGRAWHLNSHGSNLNSLIEGRGLFAQVDGQLGPLSLEGEYSLQALDALRDLSAKLHVHGTMPPRIAQLSPIFDADTPVDVRLIIGDVDPGIAIDLKADLHTLDIHLSGTADRPESGDGIDLALKIDAGSLPRLARALDLGETEELPLTIDGRIDRDGRAIAIPRFDIHAGEHWIRGSLRVPSFPLTTDAELQLDATGPDFSFYQRLLERPSSFKVPYEIQAQLTRSASGKELLLSSLRVGEAHMSAEGSLGDAPNYHGSEFTMQASFDDLEPIGGLVGAPLPSIPALFGTELSVAEQGKITIHRLNVDVAGARASLAGGLNTYPALDKVDLMLNVQSPSLATTAGQLGVAGLGDVPAKLELRTQGSLAALRVDRLNLETGGLSVTSTAGDLAIVDGNLSTDFRFDVSLENLPELLGEYANEAMSAERYEFTLAPTLSEELLGIELSELSGPGVQGSAAVALPRDLSFNDQARINADLALSNIALLMPGLRDYTPPEQALRFVSDTRGGTEPQLRAQVLAGDNPLLSIETQVPARDDVPMIIAVRGRGADLHAFGSTPALPERVLPYAVDADLSILGDEMTLAARNIELDGSRLLGNIRFDSAENELVADLSVPQANLQPWLAPLDDDSPDEKPPEPSAKNERVIPANPLPLDWLRDYRLDIQLQTGPLGIEDPFFDGVNFVDAVHVHHRSGDGRASLQIKDLRGARGNATGLLEVTTQEQSAHVSLDFDLTDFPIGITVEGPHLSDLPKHDVDLELVGQGTNPRELAASLNGKFLMSGGAGVLKDMGLAFATESFGGQLMTAILPGLETSSKDMEVECTVLAAQIDEGRIVLNPGLVLRTSRVDLSARGQLDLSDEKLAIRFDNQARKGLGISAASLVNPYVQITGTLGSPKLGLDVTGSAIAGGAAVATGGLTVLAKPLYGRFLNRKNPCKTALERWAKRET